MTAAYLRGAASPLNQSQKAPRRGDAVSTDLTMRYQCGLYEKCAIDGVKCRTDA
ncbi:hypothetical protein AXO13_004632 [Salmonella enterica subsp. enterica serovar Hadar]|nr:hypothetical protein [Salmonella enterica subsp. enterica serovar Hadar]EDS6738241.1 hypothetical protein [Salmonella enterica subsp. enterica]EDR0928587.1 hypothetical protein [Salmonella enterica subsp. enterica serovar Hadar]EDT3560485.1 hypothetical protein [Salmonella enterica subsp. enterica]EDT4564678.1 hypothetical protein [Salmonella enterica subsp. enterica serovar Hadar]